MAALSTTHPTLLDVKARLQRLPRGDRAVQAATPPLAAAPRVALGVARQAGAGGAEAVELRGARGGAEALGREHKAQAS